MNNQSVLLHNRENFQGVLTSSATTTSLAQNLSKLLLPGDIIFLEGPLGAGKTFLSQQLLFALGYHGKVLSPTYSLVQSYEIHHSSGTTIHLHHFDLYRLADPEELEFMGIRDYVSPNTICLIEWPSKGEGVVPKASIEITLDYCEDYTQTARNVRIRFEHSSTMDT